MKNPTHSHHMESGEYVPWNLSDVLFAYVFIFVLSIIFAGTLIYSGLDFDMNVFAATLQILLSFSTLGVVYFIITQKYHSSFTKSLGLSLGMVKSAASLGIFVTAIIILVTTIITLIFSLFAGTEPQNPYIEMSEERLRWLTILALFLAPVVEEVFFRGFMQPAITKITGPFLGILITAVIFGVSHTQYLDYSIALISVTMIGVILGITKYQTGSIMPGIFAHFFNNLLALTYIMS